MPRYKRFQSVVTAGHFTLPIAILVSAICWILAAILLPENVGKSAGNYPFWNILNNINLPTWGNQLISFLLYGIIGFLLIGLNNTFAIIRMRASVQTALYFLLITACPGMHHQLNAGDLAAITFLAALYFLFHSYQRKRPESDLLHSFALIGLGSLVFPQLTWLVPIFWIGASSFQSLHVRSFFASLIGWSIPYWFLFGHAFFYGEMELFYAPFRELVTFHPILFRFRPEEIATLGYMFVLFAGSAGHCLVLGYEDKIRTRSYLQFIIFLTFCLFVYIVLQPMMGIHLLPILLIGVSILAGHLFVLTDTRSSNVFFICMLVGLFLLFGFNVWTLS